MITAQFKYSSTWERIQGFNTVMSGEPLFLSNAFLVAVDLMQLYAQYMFTQLCQRHIVKGKVI